MAAPYDIVNDALNFARARINDQLATIVATGGKILQDTEAFTQVMANSGWRNMQKMLVSLGWSGLKNQQGYTALPAAAVTDPLVQVALRWDGYYNGSTLNTGILLPPDMIQPDDIWERINGAVNGTMYTMDRIVNGLPYVPKGTYNKLWEWRHDAIYMPGSQANMDILIRYTSFYQDFLDNSPTTNTAWYGQQIPIVQASDVLGYFIAVEFCRARDIGGLDPAGFQTLAAEGCKFIAERDTNRAYAPGKMSEYSKMQDRFTATPNPKPGPQKME